ncbi:MAG TPA: VWA domain-containing protein [Pyrinomonadaceae bacterium]|nr:VWA domain-containing protein [Pyrinomonadaceae bacterium]
MKSKTLLAFVLTFSLLAQTVAQDPVKQVDVVRVDTNLVQIDVVVTDKNGKQVTDLKPEDFEVSEDGKKRSITHFSYIDAVRPTAATEASNAPPESKKDAEPVKPARLKREQVRRTVALVLDDLGLSFDSLGYARQAMRKFVDEQMQPNDMVAVLRTSAGVGVLQQFTSDKRQLHAAIERVRWNPAGRGGLSPLGTMNEQSIGADIRDNIQFIEEMEESRAGQYSVGTIGTINAIVRGLGEMPGRKSIVLISEAFRLFSAQGRNVELVRALRRLTDEANANSVAIYTIDASGLQSYSFEASDKVAGYSYLIDPQVLAASGGPAEGLGAGGVRGNPAPRTLPRVDTLSAQAEQDSGAAFRRLAALSAMREQQAGETYTVLSYLAQRTGGIFERNRNDLGVSIERIMQDQQGYYLLGYRPDESTIQASGGRRLHHLNVKAKRSGLRVRSRASYVGVTEEDRRSRPKTRAEQLTAALISPFAAGDINVQLTSLFRDEARGGGTYLRSLLHIDAKDLTFKEEPGGTRTAELETVAVAFGDNGQIVDQLSYVQTVRAANSADYERTLRDGLVYILDFPLKRGGPYQMRVAVRDATSERHGTAMQFVEAPDLTKDRLALSGIVLSSAEEADKTSAAEQDIQSGPAVRRLRPGSMIDYRFIVYNAQTDAGAPVQMQMRLLRDGKPVFTGKLTTLDVSKEPNPKRISTGGRLRMGPDLTPGDYVLHVAVQNTKDPKKPRTASQSIDFEIVP